MTHVLWWQQCMAAQFVTISLTVFASFLVPRSFRKFVRSFVLGERLSLPDGAVLLCAQPATRDNSKDKCLRFVPWLHVSRFPIHTFSFEHQCFLQPRLALYKHGYWCDPSTPLKQGLKTVFQDFKNWKSQHRISCSQPSFTEKLDAWTECQCSLQPETLEYGTRT